MQIKEKIIEIIEENGIEIQKDGTLEHFNSIEFVSMLVSVEQTFNIEIPDAFLISDHILDVESITAIVESEMSKVSV